MLPKTGDMSQNTTALGLSLLGLVIFGLSRKNKKYKKK
ncbi:LPXTG cell wall anchor domain-containing protein [Enterococcus faecalis]